MIIEQLSNHDDHEVTSDGCVVVVLFTRLHLNVFTYRSARIYLDDMKCSPSYTMMRLLLLLLFTCRPSKSELHRLVPVTASESVEFYDLITARRSVVGFCRILGGVTSSEFLPVRTTARSAHLQQSSTSCGWHFCQRAFRGNIITVLIFIS